MHPIAKQFFRQASKPALAAGMVACMTMVAYAETRLLRYGDFGPNRGTRAEAMQWLDTELRARTNDELGISFVWGGALVNAKTAIDSIADGVADMGSIVPVYSPGKLVSYELADVLQYPDEWVGMSATYDLMTSLPDVKDEWDKAGLVYFGNFTTGPTQLLSKTPIKSLSDFDGLTVRATGGFVPAFKSAGASTVSLGQPQVYEALSNGTVDASMTYYYTVVAYKQYEQAQHITEMNMGQTLGFGIAMNKDTFDSLSPEHQAIVTELGREFSKEYYPKIMWESRKSAREQLQKGIDGHEVTVHTPDAELVPKLTAAAIDDTQNWLERASKKGLPADDLLASYKELVEKYTNERDTNGYPWAD